MQRLINWDEMNFIGVVLQPHRRWDSTEEQAEPFFSLYLRRVPFNSINQPNQRINLESLSLQPLSFDHSFRLLLNATN
jgi:hypothetical protein